MEGEQIIQEARREGFRVHGPVETGASIIGGAGLAVAGLKEMADNHFWRGAALALAGGAIVYLGASHNHLWAAEGKVMAKRTITVNRPVEEVFGYWKNFENFPNFMRHIESVTVTGRMVSHWVARAHGGRKIEWDSEIVEMKENELIRWRSLAGSDVHSEGQVIFRKDPHGGTELEVEFTYIPEGRGAAATRMLGVLTGYYMKRDLRRFKSIMEEREFSVLRKLEKGLAQA